MKIYLVGGAVRDRLLSYPVHEKDWVVVGATDDELIKQGYRRVGKDFPVFLHPQTQEEYALARKERKSGQGYYGFDCEFSPEVTLEEDLLRRDLTINAMAMDENGDIIDPYHGQQDLKNKLLRHVSPAFAEDPVRVLRLARFAARYHHLGFRVADETRQLMYQMVQQGELHHLVAERVWQEWQKSLTEKNPEQFIDVLRSCGALSVVLPEIDALFGVPNPRHYHPEIDSGIHTLMVLQQASAMTEEPDTRFAALVHDLGKAITPLGEWPRHRGHDKTGLPVIEQLCLRLRIPASYRKLALKVCELHLNLHRIFELKAATIVRTLEQMDAFRRPEQFDKILIAVESDAKGVAAKKDYPQADAWRFVQLECAKITSKAIVEQGYEGEAVKEQLTLRRLACVKLIKKSWELNEK